MRDRVLAAGGVLWRPSSGGLEVALVHRPRYDDWSLPKGKLHRGEHPLAAAVREVHEETGVRAVAGRTLGTSSYDVLQDGVLLPKTVRWWALRAGEGAFVPGDEVDELRWLDPVDAAGLLTAGRDDVPLRLLGPDPAATGTVLLVRHGSAGHRGDTPDDAARPLDDKGTRQAAALAALLPAYGVTRVLSSPAVRCRETVAPLAQALGLAVEPVPLLAERGWGEDRAGVLDLVRRAATAPGTTVLCSHRGPLPGIVEELSWAAGQAPGPLRAPKGSTWAVSLAGGALVDADLVVP